MRDMRTGLLLLPLLVSGCTASSMTFRASVVNAPIMVGKLRGEPAPDTRLYTAESDGQWFSFLGWPVANRMEFTDAQSTIDAEPHGLQVFRFRVSAWCLNGAFLVFGSDALLDADMVPLDQLGGEK